MHYYKRNIGDYAKKAGRLSILQHGVYNLLIDACYDREQFPTRSDAIDWVWASTQEEIEAVDFILNKFFDLNGDIYIQNRIQEELIAYQDFCTKQEEKGKKGGRPKGSKNKPNGLNKKPNGFENKPNGNPTVTQRGRKKTLTTNHKPLTTNQLISFDQFWAIYPRKESKSKAEQVWLKLRPDQELFDLIKNDIDQRLESGQWTKAEKKFIPHPTSYLNQERWNDNLDFDSNCPVDKIIESYHVNCPELLTEIPERWKGSKRESDLINLWEQSDRHQDIQFWDGFFKAVSTIDSLKGQNKNNWKASLGWLVERENFDSVLNQLVNGARQ